MAARYVQIKELRVVRQQPVFLCRDTTDQSIVVIKYFNGDSSSELREWDRYKQLQKRFKNHPRMIRVRETGLGEVNTRLVVLEFCK